MLRTSICSFLAAVLLGGCSDVVSPAQHVPAGTANLVITGAFTAGRAGMFSRFWYEAPYGIPPSQPRYSVIVTWPADPAGTGPEPTGLSLQFDTDLPSHLPRTFGFGASEGAIGSVEVTRSPSLAGVYGTVAGTVTVSTLSDSAMSGFIDGEFARTGGTTIHVSGPFNATVCDAVHGYPNPCTDHSQTY